MSPATAALLHPWVEDPDVSAIVTEDDAPVDNFPSEKQQRLLTEPLYSSWSGPGLDESGAARPFVAAANVGLFPALKERPLVPDVFLSLDVELHQDWWQKKNRSYFFWELGKPPEVVIEIVSNAEGEELGQKRRRYAKMGIGHYVVYDPTKILGGPELQAFELRGRHYVSVPRATSSKVELDTVGLGLTLWQGSFEGRQGTWLRWCFADGSVVPTGAERAEAERTRAEAERGRAEAERGRAEAERGRAEAERSRAERLAARLRALGVDPDAD